MVNSTSPQQPAPRFFSLFRPSRSLHLWLAPSQVRSIDWSNCISPCNPRQTWQCLAKAKKGGFSPPFWSHFKRKENFFWRLPRDLSHVSLARMRSHAASETSPWEGAWDDSDRLGLTKIYPQSLHEKIGFIAMEMEETAVSWAAHSVCHKWQWAAVRHWVENTSVIFASGLSHTRSGHDVM